MSQTRSLSDRVRITRFEVIPILVYDSPLANISGIHGPVYPRIFGRCELSNGTVGWGEIPCSGQILDTLSAVSQVVVNRAIDDLDQILLDLEETTARHLVARDWTDQRGNESFDQGIARHVRAVAQMSLSDAHARHNKATMAEYLANTALGQRASGGKAPREEVEFLFYAFFVAERRGVPLPYDDVELEGDPWTGQRNRTAWNASQLIEQIRCGLRRFGNRTVKLKGGVFSPRVEADCMLALRDAFPNVKLTLDPNGAWTVTEAIDTLRKLESVLDYAEDPVFGRNAADARRNMAEVHSATGMALATNMCASDFTEHEDAIARRAIQITLGGDPHYMGGSDRAVALSNRCEEWGIDFGCHSNVQTGISHGHVVAVGAAAANHRRPFDSHIIWQCGDRDVVTDQALAIRGGTVQVPRTPGIGVEPAPSRVDAAHRRFSEYNSDGRTYTDRRDDLVAPLFFPGWVPRSERTHKWCITDETSR